MRKLEIVTSQKSGGIENQGFALPPFLQKEETAAQIVALMQAKFSRPKPQDMLEILKCAEMQITGLQQSYFHPSLEDRS
jgi:hypothetical protein